MIAEGFAVVLCLASALGRTCTLPEEIEMPDAEFPAARVIATATTAMRSVAPKPASAPVCVGCLARRDQRRRPVANECADMDCPHHAICSGCGGPTDGRRALRR